MIGGVGSGEPTYTGKQGINMTKISTPESSTIASIDHDDNKLIVEFKSGGTYHYDAPASVFEAMKAAPSKGKFHHSDIKGKYQHTKITA